MKSMRAFIPSWTKNHWIPLIMDKTSFMDFHGKPKNLHGTFMDFFMELSWNFSESHGTFMDFFGRTFSWTSWTFFETCVVMDFFLEQENVQNFSQKERRKPNTFDRTPSFS